MIECRDCHQEYAPPVRLRNRAPSTDALTIARITELATKQPRQNAAVIYRTIVVQSGPVVSVRTVQSMVKAIRQKSVESLCPSCTILWSRLPHLSLL